MTMYSYRACDANGLQILGQLESFSPEAVRDALAEQGLIPLSVAQGAKRISKELSLGLLNHVDQQELMLFTRQFHTLFKAGMDMETLLNTLANQTKNKFFGDSIRRIKSDVAAGSSLSRAFGQHPKIFNDLYINMLATGEEAGILDEVLGQISTVLEKDITLKAAVKSATLYPKIVVFVLIAAATVMLTFVIPKFASFYGHYNAELPLPTRIMIALSNFLRNDWYMALGLIGAITFAFKKWKSTSRGRFLFDKFIWKLPVFGPLGQKVANARYSNIVAALYKAGLPITRGLEICAKTIGNEAFEQEVMQVRAEVQKGRSISEAMREGQYFSPLLIEATHIGEKSGSLDEMYFSIGEHYDKEVGHTLKNLTTLIEPIMLFAVFGMVTLFALAIFLPMWNMSKVVLHH